MALAVPAAKKLRSDELYLTRFGATRLKLELELELHRVPLWRADHVDLNKLVEDFARYSTCHVSRNQACCSKP